MATVMKGVWYSKLVGRELSLLLIALVCATIFLWSLERIPLVTTVIRPKDVVQLSTDREMQDKQVEGTLDITESKINTENLGFIVDNEHEIGMNFAISETNEKQISSNSSENSKTNEECDFAKGKWVVDDRLPLYSGFGCKQWLSQMWACRTMQRQDFSFEKLRWQPKNCKMELFEGSKFLQRMKNKTIALVGDSLGRQQFQSLMCMITGGEERPDVVDVGYEYGLVKAKGAVRPDGWAYRFPATQTTVLYYWSACLCDLQPLNSSDPLTDVAMHLDRPPEFLRRYLPVIDVLVLNTGHHWNRGKISGNRWIMYINGAQNTNKKLLGVTEAKNFTVHSIVKWVDSQLAKHPRVVAFYRSISPRHFVNGDWNSGGSCDNEKPTCVGKEVAQEVSSDGDAEDAVKGTRVKLLDITALSQVRDEGHISKYSHAAAQGVQDCLHWCLPGVPDSWNEILSARLAAISAA